MTFWISMLATIALDQLSKWIVISAFAVGESRPVIEGLLWLTHVNNTGAAFSLMQGKTLFFLSIALLAVGVMIYYVKRYPQTKYIQLLLGLIAGGAIGNSIDRLRFQHVVDFIDLGWWPVFNLADTAIVCAGILIVFAMIREEKKSEE